MSKTAGTDFFDRLQIFTEKLLTRRARKIHKNKVKRQNWSSGREWLDAFLWAIMMVLLLNQYLMQSYQIPSGSMRDTLIGGKNPYTGIRDVSDRIFVNKFIFGPELLPGWGKLPAFRDARRGEVIIFENPEFENTSLTREIAQRVLYMMTFTMLDLNRKNGVVAPQFLIKRLVGKDGDRVTSRRGEVYIQPIGERRLRREADFKQLSAVEYGNHLMLGNEYYADIDDFIRSELWSLNRLRVSADMQNAAQKFQAQSSGIIDTYEYERIQLWTLHNLYPASEQAAFGSARSVQGVYVPHGWMLPLGDNRNNSLDGRSFGPVPSRDLLGRAMFIFWPINRLGAIR